MAPSLCNQVPSGAQRIMDMRYRRYSHSDPFDGGRSVGCEARRILMIRTIPVTALGPEGYPRRSLALDPDLGLGGALAAAHAASAPMNGASAM
jgi:hypothetical protein